jgi:hypothetical protein
VHVVAHQIHLQIRHAPHHTTRHTCQPRQVCRTIGPLATRGTGLSGWSTHTSTWRLVECRSDTSRLTTGTRFAHGVHTDSGACGSIF